MNLIKSIIVLNLVFTLSSIHAKAPVKATNITAGMGVGAAHALADMTGNSYAQAAVSAGAGAFSLKMASNPADPWTKAFWVMGAITEFDSAYKSFKNGKKTKSISAEITTNGQGIECNDASCSNQTSNIDNSDPVAMMQTDDAFAQFTRETHLDEVYGEIRNPKTALDELGAMGYGLDGEGNLIKPDGSKYTKEDAKNDLAKSSKLGSDFNKAQKNVQKLNAKKKKYLSLIDRYQSSNSGGYANSARSKKKGSNSYGGYKGFSFKSLTSKQRKTASKAGSLSYVKGDPISAQGDNVFHIIERAYDKMVVDKSLKQPK